MRIALALLAGVLVLVGSASSQSAASTPFRVRLERTICYGLCPEYVVTVRADGRVVYVGRRGVLVRGVRRARLGPTAMRKLRRAVSSTDVFRLDSRYEEMSVTDLPSAKLTVQVGSRTKRIYHYLGDFTAPEKLTRLECTVDRILRTRRWVGRGNESCPPPRNAASTRQADHHGPRLHGRDRTEDVLDTGEARTGGRALEQGHRVNLSQSLGPPPARSQNRR